jgi:hypothetical protein
MNCPLLRISDNSARGRRDEAISGIRHEAGDEGAGSDFAGERERDQVDSSGGYFRNDAPDDQEDVRPLVVTWFSKRESVGWEARSVALSGAWPVMFLNAGSRARIAASLFLHSPGTGEQWLPHQGQKVVFDLLRITRVMEAAGGFLGEAIAPVQFARQQATGIRGYPAALDIGNDFLGKKAFKGELLRLSSAS